MAALYGGSYEAVVSSFSEIIIVMFNYCMDQLLINKQHGRLIKLTDSTHLYSFQVTALHFDFQIVIQQGL